MLAVAMKNWIGYNGFIKQYRRVMGMRQFTYIQGENHMIREMRTLWNEDYQYRDRRARGRRKDKSD